MCENHKRIQAFILVAEKNGKPASVANVLQYNFLHFLSYFRCFTQADLPVTVSLVFF